MPRSFIFAFTIANVLLPTLLVAQDKRVEDAAIYVNQPIGDAVAMLRQRRIETRTHGFQEIRHDPDIAEVIFDLEKGVITRAFYSVSKKRIIGLQITVYPAQGASKITERQMEAKSIRLEDDGSYIVHFVPPQHK